ncbi:MAG: translation initiation factor IF-1 [Pedosphaera sp.]|nr:translation initiation factor IF-1 [Pedosphaera sp.]
MAGTQAFRVEGEVIEIKPNNRVWVRLANGHRLFAFAAKRGAGRQYIVGQHILVDVWPFDLSKGKIVLEEQQETK